MRAKFTFLLLLIAFVSSSIATTACCKSLGEKLENKFYQTEKYEEAMAWIEEHIKNNPNDYEGYHEMGKLLLLTNMPPETTLQYMTKPQELSPNNKDVTKLTALIYSLAGDKENAYKLFNELLASGFEDLEMDQWYIESAYAYGDYEKAEGLCNNAMNKP